MNGLGLGFRVLGFSSRTASGRWFAIPEDTDAAPDLNFKRNEYRGLNNYLDYRGGSLLYNYSITRPKTLF